MKKKELEIIKQKFGEDVTDLIYVLEGYTNIVDNSRFGCGYDNNMILMYLETPYVKLSYVIKRNELKKVECFSSTEGYKTMDLYDLLVSFDEE